MSELIPLVVALLVCFFGLLLAGHGFASRNEPGMSTFAFAPLGIAGMTLAGALHGFSPIPQLFTTALAMISAPLSFSGFAIEAWRDRRVRRRAPLVAVAALLILLACVMVWLGGVLEMYVIEPSLIFVRVLAFGPPAYVFLNHLRARAIGEPAERRYSTQMTLAIGGAIAVAILASMPVLLRTPWNVSDPLLWVALAALAATLVQVKNGRMTVRLFASRAVTWLLLFLGLVAVLATAARQLDVGLNLPQILAGVVTTLLIGVGFVVVGEAVSRQVDVIFSPRQSALEIELERARASVQSMQSKWSHLERLALTGELSAMVAHEIKNPLAAVRGWAEVISELTDSVAIEDRPRFAKAVAIIQEESDRIDARVQSLLQLARPSLPSDAPSTRFSVRQIASQAVALVELQALPVVLALQASDGAYDVEGNADGLRGALVNLLRNARDAQHEGTITIELARDDRRVLLTVIDTGTGLSAEHLAAPIVAFRSTKPQGTGLGLVIAQAGISACGGTLRFEPNSPRGTRAIIELPSSEARHG